MLSEAPEDVRFYEYDVCLRLSALLRRVRVTAAGRTQPGVRAHLAQARMRHIADRQARCA
jgi:hypothetical protein